VFPSSLSFCNYIHSNLLYIMLHIILKILGYVPLYQKGYKSGCSQMDFLVLDEGAAREFYRGREQLISQVIKAGTITCYVKRQWKFYS